MGHFFHGKLKKMLNLKPRPRSPSIGSSFVKKSVNL